MKSIWRSAPFAVVSVALLLGLGVVPHVSHAQNSQQEFLDAHNSARANVGVGALIWDDTVASYAQDYANQRAADCALQHSGTGQYGENILAGGTGDYSAVYAVNRWVSEGSYYDYNSNTCSADTCLHYTQVVWRDSKNLGCAKVTCDNGGTFITCNYDPPGNIDGQRPY